MCSTSAAGGIATAFVADPTDVLGDGADALDRVVAQTGSKITKIWESATIVSKLSPDLLYTSDPPTGDKRLSSPGRFWLVVESKPTTSVPLTVYCDWAVELFVPSLESKEGQGGAIVIQDNFFGRKDRVGLWHQTSGSEPSDDPRLAIPGIEFGTVYETAREYYHSFKTVRDGNFSRFKLVNDSTHGITLAPVDPAGKVVIDQMTTDQWSIVKGETFTPLPNLQERGLEFLCQPPVSAISRVSKAQNSRNSFLPSGKSFSLNSTKLPSCSPAIPSHSSEKAPTLSALLEKLTVSHPQQLASLKSLFSETREDGSIFNDSEDFDIVG